MSYFKRKKSVLLNIHHQIRVWKGKEIGNHLREIERTKNDSTRMFQAIKYMQ